MEGISEEPVIENLSGGLQGLDSIVAEGVTIMALGSEKEPANVHEVHSENHMVVMGTSVDSCLLHEEPSVGP